MEQKLKLAEQAKDEFHKLTEELKKTLEDKEKEVRQAKEVAVLEYRDSDALISEFGVSYNDGFDDALRQVKALYPKLDVSSVNISVLEQTFVHLDQSEDTNELFGEDVLVTNAPVVLTVEEESKNEEARQAKESEIPDASWRNFSLTVTYYVWTFWEQLWFTRHFLGYVDIFIFCLFAWTLLM